MHRWLFVSLLVAQFLYNAPVANLTARWQDSPLFTAPLDRSVTADGSLNEPPGDKEEDPPPSSP
jgi:hypothetical protein